jgi:hypothetical protein
MTTRHLFTTALAILGSITSAFAADPVVSNLTASQRAGTKLVDITYDVTADTPTVKVTLEISSDGGTTYSVPVTSATPVPPRDLFWSGWVAAPTSLLPLFLTSPRRFGRAA